MSVVAECLSSLKLGEPQTHLNLQLFPLIGGDAGEPAYRLLDEALAQGTAHVTEVSESGSVPELKFVNEGDLPVLLLDGEELVGAKQNRILNLTVLAPAHKTIVIPVSCVEAGRWRAESREFRSGGRAHYAEGRARKAADVSMFMSAHGEARSDQSEVWRGISEKAARLQSHSDTDAAEAMYHAHRARLDEFLGAFSSVDNQTGALFAINGQVIGLDLFDSPSTLASLLPKLVESYALDAIDAQREPAGSTGAPDAQGLLEGVGQARTEAFPAVGEGRDLRLHGENLAGGALITDAKVIHLCAFRIGGDRGEEAGPRSRFVRASQRRRVWS